MSRVPDYSNTIIYKLCCKDPSITEIYVGHTTNFIKRKCAHKVDCKTKSFYVYQFIRDHGGFENWDMVEVCRVDCLDKRDASKVERKYVEELRATLNMRVPSRTQKEWIEDNRDHVTELSKIWRETHPDKYIEINRRSGQSEKHKKYITDNKESLNEYYRNYYIQNREKKLLKAKERRAKSKESSRIII
jgi:hypothetical protein